MGPCGAGTATEAGTSGSPVALGTTDKVTFPDPTVSDDTGSYVVMNQIYPFLLNSAPGSADPKPDIAESASFTAPTDCTVKPNPGLTWANGPAAVLANVGSVSAPDATPVEFKLKSAKDQTLSGC